MITETLKNPNAPTIPNPVGIDVAIKNLQLALLSGCPWLQKSFHRAFTMPRNDANGARVVEPMTYQGSKEYYPVLPNDALNSYSFWRVNGPRAVDSYAPNLNTGGKFFFKDPVDLIVWFDLKKIDPSKDWIYSQELLQDVMKVLNRNPDVSVVRVWDDRVEDIYKGYTLQPTHRDLLMYPYGAFRLEIILSYSFECQP